MKKHFSLKFLSIAISLCLLFSSLFTGLTISAANTSAKSDVWDGTTVSNLLSGTGTQSDPYLIQSADDFAYFANESRAGGDQGMGDKFLGKYFELNADISLNDVQIQPLNEFSGTFDGAGYEISGIKINGTRDRTGLFTIVSGTIKNLTLSGSVTSSASYVGGFAGEALSSANFINCVNNINVTSDVSAVGGFCGDVAQNSNVTITSCINNGQIKTTSTDANRRLGGFIGYIIACEENAQTNVVITLSQNNGDIVCAGNQAGGLVGQICKNTNITIANCINTGDVTAGTQVGGIIANFDGIPKKATIENTINVGRISTTRSTGRNAAVNGIVGYVAASAKPATEEYINTFYRTEDININGATVESTNDISISRGVIKLAAEFTDGTIAKLLNQDSENAHFIQGAEYPILRAVDCTAGDINLDDIVDLSDAILVLRHIEKQATLQGVVLLTAADFNGDGVIDNADYSQVKRFALKGIALDDPEAALWSILG